MSAPQTKEPSEILVAYKALIEQMSPSEYVDAVTVATKRSVWDCMCIWEEILSACGREFVRDKSKDNNSANAGLCGTTLSDYEISKWRYTIGAAEARDQVFLYIYPIVEKAWQQLQRLLEHYDISLAQSFDWDFVPFALRDLCSFRSDKVVAMLGEHVSLWRFTWNYMGEDDRARFVGKDKLFVLKEKEDVIHIG